MTTPAPPTTIPAAEGYLAWYVPHAEPTGTVLRPVVAFVGGKAAVLTLDGDLVVAAAVPDEEFVAVANHETPRTALAGRIAAAQERAQVVNDRERLPRVDPRNRGVA